MAGSAWLALVVQSTPESVLPALTVNEPVPGVGVDATEVPPTLMPQAVITALEVPVLVSDRVHTSLLGTAPARVHDITLAEICAELVNDPKRPNTNPAIAIAAIKVIAIRITVARTGLIAFLRLGLSILVVDRLLRPDAREWDRCTVC